MLLNCSHCGKTVSSKCDICVYCKTDLTSFVAEVAAQRVAGEARVTAPGKFFSLLLKVKKLGERS